MMRALWVLLVLALASCAAPQIQPPAMVDRSVRATGVLRLGDDVIGCGAVRIRAGWLTAAHCAHRRVLGVSPYDAILAAGGPRHADIEPILLRSLWPELDLALYQSTLPGPWVELSPLAPSRLDSTRMIHHTAGVWYQEHHGTVLGRALIGADNAARAATGYVLSVPRYAISKGASGCGVFDSEGRYVATLIQAAVDGTFAIASRYTCEPPDCEVYHD